MNARLLHHMARADFLERARRSSFLVTVAGAVYMGYLVNAGYVNLSIERQRGVLNSAWVGTITGMTLSLLLPLAGFYLVKNTIGRDRATGVGEILAATPLSRVAYTFGKAASNFLFLAVIVGILAVAGLTLQVLSGEAGGIDLGDFLLPLALLGLPPVAVTAALAVLFETVRWLRGSLGNALFFFLWLLLIPLGMKTNTIDPVGIGMVQSDLKAYYTAQFSPPPGEELDTGFSIGPQERDLKATFTWDGVAWTGERIAGRLGYFGAALGIALLAALFFGRFDPAREGGRPTAKAKPAADRERKRWSLSLPGWSPSSPFATLVLAELKLTLRGRNGWWTVVALGLLIAGLFTPLATARAFILPISWIWPLALWSGLGTREARFATHQLVFTGPRPVLFHSLALWTAGVLVTAAAGSTVGLRLLLAGDGSGLLAWTAGCLFVPSLALALGSWSGSGTLFEITYLLLWYIGPMNRTPGLDYIGTTPEAAGSGTPFLFLGMAGVLLAAAFAGRRRQAVV